MGSDDPLAPVVQHLEELVRGVQRHLQGLAEEQAARRSRRRRRRGPQLEDESLGRGSDTGADGACCSSSSSAVRTRRRLFASASSSLNGHEQQLPGHAEQSLQLLPVWEKEGHRQRQYAWDGRQLLVLEPHQLQHNGSEANGDHDSQRAKSNNKDVAWFARLPPRLDRPARRLVRSLQEAFFPDSSSVTPDYWLHIKWKFAQRVLSSLIGVFATQAMLYAVGVGAKRTLPAAAALNWVLKDGLGRLGKLVVAANCGRSFDKDLKRSRFLAAIAYTGSEGLEIITPLFPGYFLPIATLANVGKSIGLVTYLATNPPFMKTFALEENLGDITAKGQAQIVLADNLGLGLAVMASHAVRNHPHLHKLLPLVSYPVLACMEVFTMYHELKCVQLRSLNQERLEIIAAHWLDRGEVPSALEVSRAERLFLPAHIEVTTKLPVRVAPLQASARSPQELLDLLGKYRNNRHILSYQIAPAGPHLAPLRIGGGWPGRPRHHTRLTLSFREDSKSGDALLGILQASCLRRMLAASATSGVVSEDRKSELLSLSLEQAEKLLPEFVASLKHTGWKTGQVVIAPRERTGYSVAAPSH
eukprot:jgi/Chlat1/1679/Chrsp127S01915